MAMAKKSSKKRSARAAELSLHRDKAGKVKGGQPVAAGVAISPTNTRWNGAAGKKIEDDQSVVDLSL